MKNYVLIGLCLYSGFLNAAIEQRRFDGDDLSSLQLDNIVGDIQISVSTDGDAYVRADKVHFADHCRLSMEKVGAELRVSVTNGRHKHDDDCEVDFDITVPESIALDLENGTGDLDIENTEGELDVKIGAGDITVDARVFELAAKLGAGNIDISGLVGDVDIKSGAGDIDLRYQTKADRSKLNIKLGAGGIRTENLSADTYIKLGAGDIVLTYHPGFSEGLLDIKNGFGDITAYLPDSASVATDFLSGVGTMRNDFAESNNASVHVSVRNGVGDLRLKKMHNSSSFIINAVNIYKVRKI